MVRLITLATRVCEKTNASLYFVKVQQKPLCTYATNFYAFIVIKNK